MPIFANRNAAWLQSSSLPPQGEPAIVETKRKFAMERKQQSRSSVPKRDAPEHGDIYLLDSETVASFHKQLKPP